MHRQSLETRVINSDIRNSLLGLVFAFFLCLTAIVTASLLIYRGHDLGGGLLGGSGLASIAAIFVYGTRQRRKEREEKLKNVDRYR